MKLKTGNMTDSKQVRVDNWSLFFLQKLQMFFSKTDHCDMTLQFGGNVQLKVHRLVMNACTEYFQFLEQTCTMDDGVILMPNDLQADVIVPIVNFMYTGMLEFQLSMFEKLYKTAEIMNITVLTKLMDAQRQAASSRGLKKRPDTPQPSSSVKKINIKSELPAPLPGRKLPVWKRKNAPSSSQPYSSTFYSSESRWTPSSTPPDPLSIPDHTPKPTRFEWPEDDLPSISPLDTSFENISYTSKPLLTQEDEIRASTSFDSTKHSSTKNSNSSSTRKSSSNLDMEDMKSYVKEQKIRSGMSNYSSDNDNDTDYTPNGQGQKRKIESKKSTTLKRVKIDDNDSSSKKIMMRLETPTKGELDHNKLVSEILKKYPDLVKKNKNIKLKIMAKNKVGVEMEKSGLRAVNVKIQSQSNSDKFDKLQKSHHEDKSPWVCHLCSTDDEPMEFVLYYLFRKHMTEIHNEKFDSRLCKYCGAKCLKHNLLVYHLYVKHGMKPPSNFIFPKCNKCPFIALSDVALTKHKFRHTNDEKQCPQCKLTFTSSATLTLHYRLTTHSSMANNSSFDCQYCAKVYKAGINLFSHLKLQHHDEALRDGIVSIDENDDVEEYQPEGESKDEYILPEIIEQDMSTKKVNILSNVKVNQRESQPQIAQQLTLEPSSEAEALSNVASGIATSLGLVDIVVLNEDQQLFLQSGETNYTQQNEQPEFILPELTGNDGFTQNEVMNTDGVITQTIIDNDITSTDELVMVLTDHDYGDNQEEITSENSNIVVLYSHPVDGEQNQFITTSTGNLMLNSQTGLLELTNGANRNANSQIVDDSQIESIEMIQREIHGHDLKVENHQEDPKPVSQEQEQEQQVHEREQQVHEQEQQAHEQEQQAHEQEQPKTEEHQQQAEVEPTEQMRLQEFCDDQNKNAETSNNQVEEMDQSEVFTQDVVEDESEGMEVEQQQEQMQPQNEVEVESREDEVIEHETEQVPEEAQENLEESTEDQSKDDSPVNKSNDELQESKTDMNDSAEVETQPVEEEQKEEPEVEQENHEVHEQEEKERETDKDESFEQIERQTTPEPPAKPPKPDVIKDTKKSPSKTSKSSKIAILDDWDDTDSQQSDHKEEKKAGEAVDKLVDEWEDDDDDDNNKKE